MSTIILPYALGKADMSAFLQISCDEFNDIKQTNINFNRIRKKDFSPSINITYELCKLLARRTVGEQKRRYGSRFAVAA